MTLNDILKDPNYQGLPEAERRKVWHKLFDRQYGSDPNFMGLPEAEQSRARDMYADRVMGYEPRQVPTAEQTGYTPEKDVMLAGIKRYEKEKEATITEGIEKITPNLGVSFPVDKVNYALDPNRDQPQIRASRPTRTRDEDLKEILSGNELRPDYMLTPEMAHDRDELRSIKSIERKEMAAQNARDKRAHDIEIAKREIEREYQNNYTELATLSVNRRSWDNESREQYARLLQRQAEIEIDFPRIAMGMNEIQYKAFNLGKRFAKEHPVLAYPDAFLFGTASLALGFINMVAPGNPFFDYMTYYEQGVSSEMPTTLSHMVRGTVASAPMNIAMMVNPVAGAALTFADITSRDIKQYYDAGTLDAANVMASTASGAIQTVIEYMSTASQLEGYRSIYRKSGTEGLQSAVLKETRDAMMPSFSRAARSLAHGAITEGLEEVLQNAADRVVKMVMLDEPMPGNKQELLEWGNELAIDFAGGALGGFLMGGGATGVQIYQHNEVAKYIQHNAQSYESIQMLQQSIDLINNAQTFEDIDTASDLLREAKDKAVKEGVEHPRLLQGFNLASSAIMASRANQVQAIKAANKEKAAEITELKQKADAIRREGFEPGFETEQGAKLYDLEDQIKVKEREYKKGLQQIHSNKELEMMGEAIERMNIEMAQLHAESAGMPYDAEYDPSADQGKEIKSPVMMEGRRRETMPEQKAAPIESKQEDSTSSSEPVPIDSNTVPSQTEGAMPAEPAEPANTENDKTTSIKLDSETKQSKSLTIGKINEDVDRVDPKESKRIPEEALGGEKTVVKGRGKGSKHKIRHALISLKDILVSHDAEFNENKDYPQELQPRDRSKGASRAKNNQVTAELDPYRLMDNYLASEGRPIVVIDKDGRIIALTGNGRLIALKRRAAGEYDGIQEYEQTLREHLEDFGFNDQDTAGKVLVGVYYGDADLIQLANAMNESEGDAMSPVEQAAADAKQIANLKKQGDDIIEALDVNTEDVMSAANTGFLKLFAERLGLDITKYQTADGKWNKDFRARVENALFMYIFSNNESAKRALSAWREDETSNMKSVLTGVMNSIKLIAKYRNAVEKYKTVDLDITVDLLEAIDVITRLRKEGKTLEQEANEMDLFSDGNEAIPSDKLSLYQAIAMIKTIKRGTEFIKGYYSEAMDLADPNQMSFLYDPNTSKEDFLNQYTEGFIKRNEKKKDDRSAAQRSSTKTPATPHGEDREGSRGSDRSEEDVVSGRRLRTGANESRLNSIPDSVAEDALLGLFKSHIAKTERDGRKLTITFKDGRKLTLDRLSKNFKITMPDGRKLDVYGRTHSKTIDGTFNVFMDLVDGLNGGNRTLYHEAFHVAWKLFMTTEQIDMISRYYAKKLGPEASIVDIEEAAANAAQNWIGNRAEVPPGFRNIFRGFWDRVRHALVSLGLASENQKIEDIFWGLEQDRLQGKGTEDRTERHRFAVEESTTNPKNIINPIDKNASNDDKLTQIKALREEARPGLHSLVEEIKNTLSIDGKTSDKSDEAILEKANRPEILKDKPWHGMEHLRDTLRAKVILSDPRQIVDIARIIEKHGVGVVKFDIDKLFHPKEYGFRIMSFDLRMPNGLITELYTPIKEIEAVKKDNHKIYEKWRDKTEGYKAEHMEEFLKDRETSRTVYNNAFSAALSRLGISQDELKSSLMNSLLSLGLSQEVKFSKENAGEKQPGTQVPSSRRLNGFNPAARISAVLPSGSKSIAKSANVISTSSNKISQSSDNATFSQGKSLVADTENLNNETEVRYRLEAGDDNHAFKVMDGYKPSKTVKGYKAFVRDKDGNLKPLFVSNDISIPIGKWLEAKDTWHFQAENGLYYVPTGGEDVEAKKSKKKKDEKKTGENVPIPNKKVRSELIKRGFLPKGSKAKSVKAVAYRPGWHGSLLPLAKQLGNQTASISRKTGASFDGYDYKNVYQEDIVFAEVEFDMSNDYQGVASKETGLQRMPEKGGYQFTTNKKNEDPKNPWFISGAIKVGRVLDRSKVNAMVKKAGLPVKKWRDEINTSKGEGVTNDGVRYRLAEAYHGSGALFNRFNVKYIGTGEGAQAFGWGIYVTENEGVARDYANKIGGRRRFSTVTLHGFLVVTAIESIVDDTSRLTELVIEDYKAKHKVNPSHVQEYEYAISHYMRKLVAALIQEGSSKNDLSIARGIYRSTKENFDYESEYAGTRKLREFNLEALKALDDFYHQYIENSNLSHTPLESEKSRTLYTLSVWENHQEDVLDWMGDLTNEQIEKINKAIKLTPEMSYSKIELKNDRAYWVTKTYAEKSLILSTNDFYHTLSKELGSPKAASQFLLRAGIDGIKYPVNAMSGGTGNKRYNYVVFDDSQITILDTTRYRAVEEKNLVTIHNIPADSIEKVNNRGGMVMPSIAIIDATKTKFTGFGDASLIGDEKMIQPSAKQPLYTSDAYTPTYPKVYEIVKMDKNLEALAEYLSKKTKKKVSTWDLEANIEDQGSERYVASLLYGVMDYRKAQKEAIRTLEKYPINIEEKIFAGYTRNGKRRYIPHTVENALRIMRKDNKDDPSTFWGTSSLRGALAAKFSSLAQAKKNRDMILSKAEMEQIEEATDKMFEDIAARANAVRKNQRAFYHSDIASDIYDMARYGWGRIADWYKDDSIKEDFRSFISHLRSLPTQYFEYKPQRVVGINEFVAAVIPTGTKASTAKALRDAGLKVVKYKAGDDNARYEAVKKVSEEMGVRFRAEPSQAEIAEAERQMADVRNKYEVTKDYELVELEERSGYSKGFSEGMTQVHYKGKAFHKGDRSVIDMLLEWKKDAESDTSRQMLPSLSTQESDRLFNQFGSEIVVVHDMDIEGKWAPEDADSGRYYGYDEFRVEMTANDALNSISQIILSDEFYEYVQNTEDENTDDSQYEDSQDYRNWVWELINPLNPWYDKIVKASDSGYRADFLNFDDGSGDSRIKYKDGYLKAPNGKPTNLTERQWLQVRTQLFKDWFGDWENDPKNASKVVDGNGEPLVVYHGGEFTLSDGTFIKSENGIHFGTLEAAEDRLSKRDVDNFILNGTVEYDEDLGAWFWSSTGIDSYDTDEDGFSSKEAAEDDMADFALNQEPSFDTSYLEINPVFLNIRNIKRTKDQVSEWEAKISEVRKQGFDGISYKNEYEGIGSISYVAFAPAQIKSAAANVGTFSESNDIRYRIEDTDLDGRKARDLRKGEGVTKDGVRYRLAEAYHGSGALFNRFNVKYIGTGEGAQAFGWGIYVTENEVVARDYATRLGSKKFPADIYVGDVLLGDYLDGNNPQRTKYSRGLYESRIQLALSHNAYNPIAGINRMIESEVLKETPDKQEISRLDKTKELLRRIKNDLHTGLLYKVSVWENHQEDVLDWYGEVTDEQLAKIQGHIDASSMDFKPNIKEEIEYSKKWLGDERTPITGEDVYYQMFRLHDGSPKSASQFLLRAGIDGIKYPVNSRSGGAGDNGYNYVVFDDSQITILETTRYRVEDTDLDARLKRAHEMLKKYKANVDPKEASKKIATEIAKAKNLDPSQADEKIGRMIRAAYREGEGMAKESLAAFGIAETEAFIQTNKPDGTDKQDLTFHMEEALEYAADMGLSEADVKNLGADRFTYYLQGLNMYGYGNALTQQLNEKYAEKQALAAKGITNEALDQEISDLISLVADARLKYENMKGAAGRLLQHARWEKSNRIKDLIKIAEVITETRDAQIAEINAIEAEMAELNTMLTELEKEFDLLLDDIERLSGSRFKSDSIEELRERKRLMAEQRAEMKNRMEVLKHRLTKAREGLQTSEKQNRAIREQLDKAGQIEFTEEEQNILKQIVESDVLSADQLEAIGTTMKTGFRPTATGLKAIAPLTGSTSDLTPKQAALIQKILDHGKKPPTVTEFPLMDADWIDVVSNAFYQIILSSPVTHARNIIGNEANLALENIVNTVLGRDLRPVINSILSAKEGVRNTKEAWKHAEAYMKKYNLDVNSRIMKRFTAITRALAAEDAFYYSRNYAAQITSIAIAEAKRTGRSADYLLRNPSLAMIKQAEYEASRGTWNYDPEGILGYVTKAIETGIGMAQHGGKLGKISALLFKMNVVPFTRVVANVLNTALDWSPVGYLGAVKYATGLVDKEFKLGKGVTIRQRKVWTDEKGNAIKSPFAKRDATRQLARATMGTIMLSLAYMLLEGIISGAGPDDWEKRKQMMETGWRPNSIKIAGRWHSYMMLPIAPMLSAIANFQERRRKPGARAEEVLAATVMGMTNTILDQSFLSNLAQLMEAITGNNHRYLIRAAADTPTRVIPISPNLLRVIADAVNGKAYAPETFIQYLMYSGRPWTNGWIKANIPARIDVFGRESKKTSSFRDFPGSPVMDGQPLYVYDKNDIPHDMRSVLNTILGAGLKIPSTNAYEARVGDDQFIKLKGFDKEQFLRQRGFYLSMGLLSHQEDIEYLAKEGDIDAVKDILQKIATRATRDAKREMIYRYIDGEMRHKYSVYSKSRNRRKDEED